MIRRNGSILASAMLALATLTVNNASYEDHSEIEAIKELSVSLAAYPPALSITRKMLQTNLASRVFRVTTYGADPSGRIDSTEAIMQAISDAFEPPDPTRYLMSGIVDLGGVTIDLEGGTYLISFPLRLPPSGGGNLQIQGGTLRASDTFPGNRHLIELWPATVTKLASDQHLQADDREYACSYEYITLTNLLLDSNYRGGGVAVIKCLRINIDNCYITHFSTDGIYIQGGHETYVRNTFLGQYITAGGDPREKIFTGIGIRIKSNDNALTDVIIFSAETGVLIEGQANILTNVHCYNKATDFGGTGIYIKLPGLTQNRILNCYLDFTGIVAEDPVQLHISGTFFLGNAFILLKSIKGVIHGLNIVDNTFHGDNGADIVQLEGQFHTVEQVVVDRNIAKGMRIKATAAREGIQVNGNTWTADFSHILLFPNQIRHVQYTVQAADWFPTPLLRNVSENRLVFQPNKPLPALLYVSVDQYF